MPGESPATPGGSPATLGASPAAPAEPPAAAAESLDSRGADADPSPATDMWTCEIAWRCGRRGGVFRGLAREPSAGGAIEVARSIPVAWPKERPPMPSPELGEAMRALSGALIDAGWRPTDSGDDWYAHRFAWTRSEDPHVLGEISSQGAVERG
jgi:hypothetical protein